MQINCKKCGKDVTKNVNQFFEGVRKSPNCDCHNCSVKGLQERIANEFELFNNSIGTSVNCEDTLGNVKIGVDKEMLMKIKKRAEGYMNLKKKN